jgi:hypothetical protein
MGAEVVRIRVAEEEVTQAEEAGDIPAVAEAATRIANRHQFQHLDWAV